MSRSILVTVGLLLGIVKASLTFAQAVEVPKAADTADDEAMVQFEQGKEFFNQGQYEKAAIAMKRAYELRPGTKILFYIGWAESETGNYSRALKAYSQYLQEASPAQDADRMATVKEEVEKIRARVGSIMVVCSAAGAKIKVDNEVLGIVPLKDPISVDVGRHEVAVTDGAEEIFKEVIRIAGEQEMTIEVGDDSKQTNAAAEPTPAPIQESLKTPVSASKPKTNKGRIASFALLGAAAAVAVGAAVTGAMALDQEGEIWDRCDSNGNCYSEDYDGNFDDDQYRLRTLGITTDVLIGVASAAAVAGTVLLIVSRNKNKKERVKGRVTPAMAADFFGIFVSGRF